METKKEQGTVKWFDESKGYGFVTPEGGHKDLFFHHSHIDTLEGVVEKGERVEFEIFDGPRGQEARHVRAISV